MPKQPFYHAAVHDLYQTSETNFNSMNPIQEILKTQEWVDFVMKDARFKSLFKQAVSRVRSHSQLRRLASRQ